MKVNIKWGKELFSDVEVDLTQPPLVFKSQLFTLSGVPPDRQKVLIKGGQLKDDDWGKQQPKEGMTIMMMGTAEEVKVDAPANAPKFVEDLPEAEQNTLETKAYGSGLKNLGNTCYMNSTVQCLYSVQGLRDALLGYNPAAAGAAPAAPAGGAAYAETGKRLVQATQELFQDLQKGGEAFPPFKFLLTLRQRFPQFAQQTNEGFYMQQDAEECWTQIMYTLKEGLKDADGNSLIDKLFGIKMLVKLKCDETGEEYEEANTMYSLKCNISVDVNYLHQGITLGLVEDREKNSSQVDRLVQFKGTAYIAALPPYLTVQMMRFFYKRTADGGAKAKILRKVTFPMELDVYDFCTPELQQQLKAPREALKAHQDKLALEKRTIKQLKTEDGPKPGPGAAAAAAAAGEASQPEAAAAASSADVEMKDADTAAAAAPAETGASSTSLAGALTGKYELAGVLTHKGRSADSGHYVSWVKQKDGSWVLFDDDELIIKTDEDVLALSGGGDWHMAYLLLYRAIKVPEAAAAAAQEAATAAVAATTSASEPAAA